MDQDRVRDFFACARERHAIYLRRAAGMKPPWTEDPIFQQFRFTNIFRELDRTTVWFRENVRVPLRGKPEVLLATVLFRLFNRVTTGEAIFRQPALGLGDEKPGETAWDAFLRLGKVGPIRAAVLQYCSPGPYVTGAYIIKTPTGLDKLDGVLWIVEQFATLRRPRYSDGEPPVDMSWREFAELVLEFPDVSPLHWVWQWLMQFPFIGHFTAYEIVTDLRHTALLEQAPDIMTWANAGPGASRGLNYIHGRDPEVRVPKTQQVGEMRELLALSRRPEYWPQAVYTKDTDAWAGYTGALPDSPNNEIMDEDQWSSWEMRDVEMWLCEMAKRWRYQAGGAPPRGRFRS